MTPYTLLITRSEPGASRTASRARSLGFNVMLCPLAQVEPLSPPLRLEGVTALAFTSTHGVSRFAELSTERRLPVFAVGEATAKQASELGFTEVTAARGDVGALAEALIAALKPGARVLHVRGELVAGDLATPLKQAGLALEQLVSYRLRDRTDLPVELTDRLARDPAVIVLVHSPAGAQRLLAALRVVGLAERIPALGYAAISAAAARPLKAAGARRIAIAQYPDDGAVIAAAQTLTA